MDRKRLEDMARELAAIEARVAELRAALSEALGRDLPPATGDGGSPSASELPASPGPESGGMANVLDLSGDVKKVQLALLRKGQASAEELAAMTGLDAEELRIYLKTLERQGTVTRVAGTGGAMSYRAVVKKKGKGGAGSLLDKLG